MNLKDILSTVTGSKQQAPTQQTSSVPSDALQTALQKAGLPNINETVLKELQGVLGNTNLDEEAGALIEKLDGALSLPIVGDQLAKQFHMNKADLQAKLQAVKEALKTMQSK